MKRSIILIIAILSSFLDCVYAQPVVLTENDEIGFVHATTIDKVAGNIGKAKATNLKIDLFDSSLPRDYRINDRGDRINVNRKLIQNLEGSIQIIEVAEIKIPIDGNVDAIAKFTEKDNTIILYRNQETLTDTEAYNSLIIGFYDLNQNAILKTYIFKNNYQTFYQISHDGSTILGYENGHILNLYSLTGEEYIQSIHGPYYTSIYPRISQSGNRVFFQMRTSVNEELQWVYLEKQLDGWSKETLIPISPLNINGQEVEFVHVTGVANDGHTLIVRSDIHNDDTGKYHLAVIHETVNGWSKPEYVVNFDYWIENIYNSDDGRVITLQQIKRYSDFYGPLSYDGYVFIRNDEGKWIKNKVNPEGVEVMQSMLLSGDGSTLLWNPSNSLTFPSYPDIK